MAINTNPHSQNISEEVFFAAYKPFHLRRGDQHVVKAQVVSKVTVTPVTPPLERSQTVKITSKLSPSATINTSPRSQNISEEDFFAAYKPLHLRRAGQHNVKAQAQAASKVTVTPVTPPSERSQVVKITSKLSPTAAPFTAPRTPSPEPTRNTNSLSSKLSGNAPPFVAISSVRPEEARVPSLSRSPSKLSPTAMPFTAPKSVDPKTHAPSPSSSPKLSPHAAPFSMPSRIASKVANYENKNKQVQRMIVVQGKSGPWPQYGVPCNDDNLVTVAGSQQDALEFDDLVSEVGVDNQPRQIVRAMEGEDATNQLIDWDGKHWAPVPASWEHDRAEFTGTFIPNYIREWSESVLSGNGVTLETNNEAFQSGKSPVDNDVLIAPLPQPTILSNPKPEGDKPTKAPTSEDASVKAVAHGRLMQEKQQAYKVASKQALEEIAALPAVVSQFAPSVEMYLRPVEPKDAAGIARIYNAEIQISSIPEDQRPVTVDQIAWLIKDTRKKAPFIVAIRGPCPLIHSMHNEELVIGFARAEPFDFGLSGATTGRSRGTAIIHLYVHQGFRRKHIGYNLMDRLLHMLTPAHAYMDRAKWANPGLKRYAETKGCGNWHQLFFKIPVHKKDDPTYPWLKDFLYGKFFFRESARLISAARSSCGKGGARFIDLVFLQREASASQEFEHFM